MTATATFSNPDQATYVVDTLAGSGYQLAADGSAVSLSADALAALAELPSDADGHFDGRSIWIGGTDYPVTSGGRSADAPSTTWILEAQTSADWLQRVIGWEGIHRTRQAPPTHPSGC